VTEAEVRAWQAGAEAMREKIAESESRLLNDEPAWAIEVRDRIMAVDVPAHVATDGST